MATKLKSYSTTPGSNNSAPPDGWPEGMLPSAVNNSAREMMARLAEWYTDAEWILRNDTVTGFTGTTLTITGDVTAIYAAGRAVRLDENNSKRALIISSSYSAPSTTVTVAGYTIIATPTATEIGLVNSTRTAPFPRSDVASAATTDLDSAAFNYVRITGTTTITAITLSDGRERSALFGGALTLTNGASLILPGGANITTAAGDTAVFTGETSGVVRCLYFTKAANASGISDVGVQIGYARATSTTRDSTTLQIPFDNTIPQSGEGKEYLTVSYTPKFSNSLLEVEFFTPAAANNGNTVQIALFRDAGADAIQACSGTSPYGPISIKAVVAASAASATTFKVRFGNADAATTVYLNGVATGAFYGGAMIATLSVREIKQ